MSLIHLQPAIFEYSSPTEATYMQKIYLIHEVYVIIEWFYEFTGTHYDK